MRPSQPPALADWLLERLVVSNVVSDNIAAIAGDLREEYRNGRSATWFWRQALLAILVAAWNDIRGHKLLTLRALAIGLVVDTVFETVSWNLAHLKITSVGYISSTSWWITALMLLLLACFLTGWIIGRFHRGHQLPMVLAYIAFSRLLLLYGMLPDLWLHLRNSVDQPRFRPYLAFDVAIVIVTTVGFLLGGIASGRGKRASPPAIS